ncbi:MAG TPA: DUF1080 domain-containing protein [Vicinamibacterales bacterium]
MKPLIPLFALLLLAAQPSAPDAQWRPLFDGTTLDGWQHVGDGRFVLENGLLKTEGGMGLLWYTREKFGNAVIRVVFRAPEKDDNAGVFIRIPEAPTEPWMPVNRGFEVQIDESGDDRHATGTLYSLTTALSRPAKVGEWNTLEIALMGKKTVVWLNGQKVTEYTDGQPVPAKRIWYEPERGPRPDEGYIGLQNHGERDTVYFKEVSVRPLS